MSEFYKKLAMEAGLYVDFKGKPWPKNMNGEDIEGAYKKFAELVVQDCIQKLVNHGYTDAAQCLETEYAEAWQLYNFPEI